MDDLPSPLSPEALRWRCDVACLDFATTADVAPVQGVVGQDTAVDALRFGLRIQGAAQHVFVRGRRGTGRLTLVRRLAEEVRKGRPLPPDKALVHRFDHASRPALLTVATGTAPELARRV